MYNVHMGTPKNYLKFPIGDHYVMIGPFYLPDAKRHAKSVKQFKLEPISKTDYARLRQSKQCVGLVPTVDDAFAILRSLK